MKIEHIKEDKNAVIIEKGRKLRYMRELKLGYNLLPKLNPNICTCNKG